MKKVTLHYYSAINLGDDLFVKIIAERYRNLFYVPYRSKRKVFGKIRNIRTATGFFGNIRNRVRARLGLNRPYVDLDSLEKGELFVYVGGSIFIEGDNIERWRNIEDFFMALNKPYYILGSNIGPYKGGQFLGIVRRILSTAVDASVRDRASYLLVDDLNNVRIAPDMVFNLDTHRYVVEQKKMVVFSLIDAYAKFDHSIADWYESEIYKLTQRFLLEGYEVTYMSFCRHEGDERAIERILKRFSADYRGKVRKHFYRGDIDQSLRLISASSMVVATRFHATILGMLFGKRVLPIAYSDKMLNVLNDMKFDSEVVDMRHTPSMAKINFEDISTISVTSQIKDASKHFKHLDDVLERVEK